MNERDRDLVTDKDGHPVATGVGAAVGGVAGGVAGGAAAGAAMGGMTGPVGAAVGAVVGAVAGALAGKGMAHAVDPAAEETYWRGNYTGRPYVETGSTYDDYGPAYRYGVDAYSRHAGRSFDEVDAELGHGWAGARGASTLDWERARPASRAAWQRLSERPDAAMPGGIGRDGL